MSGVSQQELGSSDGRGVLISRMRTSHGDLISRLGIAQEVGADALLRRVLRILRQANDQQVNDMLGRADCFHSCVMWACSVQCVELPTYVQYKRDSVAVSATPAFRMPKRSEEMKSVQDLHLLRVPVRGAAHAQRGGLAVVLVAVAAGGDGVQARAVRHLLAAAVHLGALCAFKGTGSVY